MNCALQQSFVHDRWFELGPKVQLFKHLRDVVAFEGDKRFDGDDTVFSLPKSNGSLNYIYRKAACTRQHRSEPHRSMLG